MTNIFVYFSKQFRIHFLLPSNKTLILTNSGGQDSTALLLFLLVIKNQYHLNLLNIYCNHLWQIPSIQLIIHLNRLHFANKMILSTISPFSVLLSEQSSRNWRYNALNRLSSFSSFDYVIVGHTNTDQIESLILNLCRGSGFFGLTTLKKERKNNFLKFSCFTEKKSPFLQTKDSCDSHITTLQSFIVIKQKKIVLKKIQYYYQTSQNFSKLLDIYHPGFWSLIWRPLLIFNRFELYQLYTILNLPIWTDKTNFQFKYRRNRIRFELLPYLRFYFNRNVDLALLRYIHNINSEGTFFQKLLLKTFKNCLFLGKNKQFMIHNQNIFFKYPYQIQKQVIWTSLLELKQNQIDYKLVLTIIKYIYVLKDKHATKTPFILLSNQILLGFYGNNIFLCCINSYNGSDGI